MYNEIGGKDLKTESDIRSILDTIWCREYELIKVKYPTCIFSKKYKFRSTYFWDKKTFIEAIKPLIDMLSYNPCLDFDNDL